MKIEVKEPNAVRRFNILKKGMYTFCGLLTAGIICVQSGFVSLAYPLYNRVLKQEREKIAPEILRLTDELLK